MATTDTTTAVNSLSNTPQAKADSYDLSEDAALKYYFDVMSNDLGGAAKTLWSLDDGVNDGAIAPDLLDKDARCEATSTDTSLNGAKIWITTDGKVGYDPSTLDAAFKAQLQALGDGESLTDTFTYAIRLGNGTLAWTTTTIVYHGANDAPVLADPADMNIADTAITDDFAEVDGQLSASDVEGDALTYGLTGAAADATVPGFDVSLTSTYGTMYLNTSTGAYRFVPDDDAINALPAGSSPTADFTFTVSDGALSAQQTLTVNVTGGNDAPVAVDDSNAATEGGAAVIGNVGTNDTDVDDDASLTYTLNAPVDGLTLGADGAYSFDPTNSAYDHLAAGATQQVVANYTVSDGSLSDTGVLTITVTGTNDTPTFGGVNTGSVTEDGVLVASDTVSVDDPDDGEDSFVTANIAGAYGSFSVATNGSWTYTLDNNDADLAELDAGEQEDEQFTVYSADGASHVITVTVHGANEGDPNDFDETGSQDSSSTQGAGHDTVYGTDGVDVINTGSGNDTIYTGPGADNVTAGPTSGSGADSDLVYAGSGDDTVIGGGNRDILEGGSGSDAIDAGAGNDTITGGYGADTLTGGEGDDEFVFLSTLDAGDTITDFKESGADEIHLEGSAFSLADGTLTASAFHAGAAAHDADDRIIYDPVTGKLYYDANGNADGGVTQLAQLDAGLTLTNEDFVVF